MTEPARLRPGSLGGSESRRLGVSYGAVRKLPGPSAACVRLPFDGTHFYFYLVRSLSTSSSISPKMSYYNRPPKDKCTACLLLLFGGVFGLHRCYLDDIVCGIAFFLTGGWCLCGICCDCCYLSALVSAANMKYAAIPSHTTVQVIMHDPHYAPPHPPVYPDAAAHYTQVPVQPTPYYAPRPGAQLPYYAPPEVSLAVAPQPSAPVAQDSITGGKKLTDD